MTGTANLLLGLLEPTSGRAEVLGFDTRTQADEVRTRTGALLEHPGVYEQLTGGDKLEFYGRVWRMTPAKRQARIKELLTHMGVWERRKERVGTWSSRAPCPSYSPLLPRWSCAVDSGLSTAMLCLIALLIRAGKDFGATRGEDRRGTQRTS